jgi:hypothetical protein
LVLPLLLHSTISFLPDVVMLMHYWLHWWYCCCLCVIVVIFRYSVLAVTYIYQCLIHLLLTYWWYFVVIRSAAWLFGDAADTLLLMMPDDIYSVILVVRNVSCLFPFIGWYVLFVLLFIWLLLIVREVFIIYSVLFIIPEGGNSYPIIWCVTGTLMCEHYYHWYMCIDDILFVHYSFHYLTWLICIDITLIFIIDSIIDTWWPVVVFLMIFIDVTDDDASGYVFYPVRGIVDVCYYGDCWLFDDGNNHYSRDTWYSWWWRDDAVIDIYSSDLRGNICCCSLMVDCRRSKLLWCRCCSRWLSDYLVLFHIWLFVIRWLIRYLLLILLLKMVRLT